jgi:predicted nucleic acid-binding protein
MHKIYLDYNCYQRSFDDPKQTRIQLEIITCQEIFNKAENNNIKLIWSFMHQDESLICPYSERKFEALRLSLLCKIRVGPDEKIKNMALKFEQNARLSSKDAIHLACAEYVKSDYFLTCDDDLIKRAKRLELNVFVLNPVEYIRKEDFK